MTSRSTGMTISICPENETERTYLLKLRNLRIKQPKDKNNTDAEAEKELGEFFSALSRKVRE